MSDRKLLLADDSVTIQKVVNLTFADEGIEVMAVGDGDTAMERFHEFRPDIVLADVNMPGMNGYRICESLRQREESAKIPVILLVGSFESFDEDEARRVGASDWLTKPFQSIRQLVAKVTELLESSPANTDAGSEMLPEQEDQPAVHGGSPDTKENEDIDDLYKQSFVETVELPAFRAEQMLGDTGMDDDMIETVHAQAATVPEVDVRDFAFEPVESVTAVDETTNGSAENTLELPASESVNFEETLPVLDFRPADVPDRTPVTYDDHETPPPAEVHEGQDVFGEKEFEVDSVPEVVTDEFRDKREGPPEFDEMNLLELPATDTNKQESRGFDEDIVTFDEAPRTDGLTPEFIDEVARKVIERISDNVIRQIAWQVVPQIVESVLREKTKKESEH